MSQNPTSPLQLLATPFAAPVLSELADGPRPLADLRPALGSPPETTARGYLRTLAAAGAVEKRRHGGFPGSFDYRLTPAGHELLAVAESLAAWLAASPAGELALGSPGAKCAIKILCEAWRAGIVRALAAGPLTLAELNATISWLGYLALKRRLALMRRSGLVRAMPEGREGCPFGVDDWLRLAVAPLLSAVRWERQWSSAPTPLSASEVEAWFLLATLAEVAVEVREGELVSAVLDQDGEPIARVDGSVDAWILALLDRDSGGFELAGDRRLAAHLVEEMQRYTRLS